VRHTNRSTQAPDGIGLVLHDVTVGHGPVALLRNISATVPARSFLGLVGVNGAGKSTLLRTLIGELPPVSGEIGFFSEGRELARLTSAGLDIVGGHRSRRPSEIVSSLAKIGVRLLDESYVFHNLTAQQNLALAFRSLNSGMKQSTIAVRMQSDFPELDYLWRMLLGQSGIAVLSRTASQLSGGERHILSLLCGLVTKPKLLLLDEPTLGISRPAVDYLFSLFAVWKTQPWRPTIVVADQFANLLSSVVDDLWDITTLRDAAHTCTASQEAR